jgi:hypothetical protein
METKPTETATSSVLRASINGLRWGSIQRSASELKDAHLVTIGWASYSHLRNDELNAHATLFQALGAGWDRSRMKGDWQKASATRS